MPTDAARIVELEEAIKWVVTQQADDLCWMDVYNRLAPLVGLTFDPAMLPKDVMLGHCDRYVTSLLSGCPYATDNLTTKVRDYEATKRLLGTNGNGMTAPTLRDEIDALLTRLKRYEAAEEERRQIGIERDLLT